MLYVVSTPIGNLEDISERAKNVLKSVSCVACEDTRHSQKLLKSIESNVQTVSFHAHSRQDKLLQLIESLSRGKDIALISDAGTPGISDPGGVLVEMAHREGIKVVPIPGPSSVTAALSASGFPADQFIFLGFWPKKKGRQTLLKTLIKEEKTVVFFESPQRIKKTLTDLAQVLGSDRKVCLCRELTKKFEDIHVGPLSEFINGEVRDQGEFVVVIRGRD